MNTMNKKILLVDDDADQTSMYSFPFTRAGFEVRCENNGAKAIATTCEYQPDLILLDIIMGDINGTDVLRELKQNEKTKQIPVVMLTNTRTKETSELVEKWGALDYWEKTKLLPKDIVARSKKIVGME